MSLAVSKPVLKATALTKRYGKARGIEDVSFKVCTGEVFGFLGPNGAGKTTMRILVRDRLRYHANLRGGVDWARVEMLAKHLELDVTRQVKHLSRGNLQKAGIVQAFMSDPELLVLDEPTSGLDPLMQQAFNQLVEDAKHRGRTVFLSSHILPEVEALCHRVAIIRDGRIVAVEQVATLKSRAKRRVEVRVVGDADARWLEGVPSVSDTVASCSMLVFVAQGPIGVALEAVRGSAEILDVSTHEPTLEDIFLSYYGAAA